jgi:hypothetical protein
MMPVVAADRSYAPLLTGVTSLQHKFALSFRLSSEQKASDDGRATAARPGLKEAWNKRASR